jgi:hypothetical protein
MVRIVFPRPVYVVAALAVLMAIGIGCQPPGRRYFLIREAFRPTERPSVVPQGVTLCTSDGPPTDLRPQRNVLALSSGGLYGAYSAGFLSGWTKTGTRPEFDTVTGASVGSLIAPYAFLGSDYDGVAMALHTGVRAEDVFRIRAWVTIPFKDAIASSAPLKKLIESQMAPELLERIAEEHRKGRRLYVATTNLSTRRLVVWDMGAIACLPNGATLFRDVLLASCAVPGMFPPVLFLVPGEDGEPVPELHGDGGITAQLFMPSSVFQVAAAASPPGVPIVPGANGNLFCIVSGKMYADASPLRQKVLPILGATTEAIMYANCRAELGHLNSQATLSGMRFHAAALRQDAAVDVQTSMSINQGEMQKLYREGEHDGLSLQWQYAAPDLCAPAPVFVRGSSRPRRR